MPIHVRLNQAGALRNQRYAFTDRFTLVSELLQNARRAGASRIEIDYDDTTGTLQVSDNGAGIEDFQVLLSLHESGWPPALRDTEQAFGVGFSQCLYSARHCTVISKGRAIAFDCEAALAQQPIEVMERHEVAPGTRVILQGVELPDWQARIERLCIGFPVPVQLNGLALSQPLAVTALDTQPNALGQVFLLGRDNGWPSADLMVFLQGFCVWRSPYSVSDHVNVVHLDPRQFLARLPDRDKLVDEALQLPRIKATVQRSGREILLEHLEQLGERLFIERYYRCIDRWELWPLLNELAWLPCELGQHIEHYPEQSSPGQERYLRLCRTPLSRQAIEQGDVQLIELSPLDDLNGALWMFAKARHYVLCDHRCLDAQHWVHAHVLALDAHPVQVTALGEQQRAQFDGRGISAPVVLCEAVRVTVGDDCIDLTNEGLCHNGVLYIPYHEWSGAVLRQASSYVDEHERYHAADADADELALTHLLHHLRCRDPQQTLLALLTELQLERYPALRGQHFVLRVGDQASALSVACLPATGGEHGQC